MVTTNRPMWAKHLGFLRLHGVDNYPDFLPVVTSYASNHGANVSLRDLIDSEIWHGRGHGNSDGFDMIAAVESITVHWAADLAHVRNRGILPVYKTDGFPDINARLVVNRGNRDGDLLTITEPQFPHGTRFLIVDDVVITGGTVLAAAKLLEKHGGQVVAIACMAELTEHGGRELLEKEGYRLLSVLQF